MAKRAAKKKSLTTKVQAYLGNGDNSMAPVRCKPLDEVIEEYIDAKLAVVDARETMKVLREERIPHVLQTKKIGSRYRHEYNGEVYFCELKKVEGVSVRKAKKSEVEVAE